MSIYLIGFMGAGKTYAGPILADYLHMSWLDLDQFLEKLEKLTVQELFFKVNEEREFRERESSVLLSLTYEAVFSTGGGVIMLQKNRTFLHQKDNFVVWLKTDFDTMYSRICQTDRPMVVKRTKPQLLELYEDRIPYYKDCADLIIDQWTDSTCELIKNQYLIYKTGENNV